MMQFEYLHKLHITHKFHNKSEKNNCVTRMKMAYYDELKMLLIVFRSPIENKISDCNLLFISDQIDITKRKCFSAIGKQLRNKKK